MPDNSTQVIPETGKQETEGAGAQTQPSLTLEQAMAELDKTRQVLKETNHESASRRKRLEELEAGEAKRKQAEMTEGERLKAEKDTLEKRLAETTVAHKQTATRYEVMLAAAKLGVVDPDAAYRLLDVSKIEFDDNGQPLNIDVALKELLTQKPWLAGKGTGGMSVTNPTGGAGGATFKRSQLLDPAFFQANKAAIMKAAAEGRIIEG